MTATPLDTLVVLNTSNLNPAIVAGGTAQAGNVFVYGSLTTTGQIVAIGSGSILGTLRVGALLNEVAIRPNGG